MGSRIATAAFGSPWYLNPSAATISSNVDPCPCIGTGESVTAKAARSRLETLMRLSLGAYVLAFHAYAGSRGIFAASSCEKSEQRRAEWRFLARARSSCPIVISMNRRHFAGLVAGAVLHHGLQPALAFGAAPPAPIN